ncbi:hypothetical protein GCM10010251_09560 [Streptomyces aurantiogriseus]|uniref:Uncharacterized protein n=1 Tax=Streptomyces aurantiogriseus TaxID=66870 RepID=A0A918BXF8_9ACTN|nr:hypothetical protein GCM10010251_09560 [Streptomyces aurantiogriseus]
MVDLQEVLQDDRLAVFVLQPGDNQLLFRGETLKRPHRGLQDRFRCLFGSFLSCLDGFRVPVLQLGMPIPEICELLP